MIKVSHSFEVHSNESACRKQVRLGLEQVKYYTLQGKKTSDFDPQGKEKINVLCESIWYDKTCSKNFRRSTIITVGYIDAFTCIILIKFEYINEEWDLSKSHM